MFHAHPSNFSTGIERLLAADVDARRFGMTILPAPLAAQTEELPSRARSGDLPTRFDVAVSFAGVNRELADRLAVTVQNAGYEVFYDNFYEAQLWGKDLPAFFGEIYEKRARYCVIFVSQEYVNGFWTDHERQYAVARAMRQKDQEYILPIKVDPVELPGVPSTVSYVSLKRRTIEHIGGMLVAKLGAA